MEAATHILVVANGDFFSEKGGGQVYVRNLVDEMILQHVQATVISFVDHGQRIILNDYKGIPVYELSPGNEMLLRRLVKRIAPDLIHVHSEKAKMTALAKELSIPIVVTAHHGGILCPAGALMNHLDEICRCEASLVNCLPCLLHQIRGGDLCRPVIGRLPVKLGLTIGQWLQQAPVIPFLSAIGGAPLAIRDKIKEWSVIKSAATLMIAPSYAIADAMIRNGMPADKIKVLPHGIPIPGRQVRPARPGPALKFFYAGRIAHIKGIHILLAAFARLRTTAELHIVGDPSNRAERRYMHLLQKKYASAAGVYWCGRIDSTEMQDEMASFDVLVHPAICLEVFGLSIAEALAMGKPVIASRCGGAEMQVSDKVNGLLVTPNSIDDLYQAMEKLSSDRILVRKMQGAASPTATMKRHVQQLTDLYSLACLTDK